MTHTIYVETMKEAFTRSHAIFDSDPECEWVVAEGTAMTASGEAFTAEHGGGVLLHRSGLGCQLAGRTTEDCQPLFMVQSPKAQEAECTS